MRNNVILILLFALLFIFAFMFVSLKADEDETEMPCTDCHDNLVEHSVHDGVISCNGCHTDIVVEEHMESGAKPAACGNCHKEQSAQQKNDIHQRLEHIDKTKIPDCKYCHGGHDVKSIDQVDDVVGEFCSDCHESVVLANPFHSKNIKEEKCLSCHEDHNFKTKVKESVHSDISCSDCHNYISNNLEEHQEKTTYQQVADCYICHNDVAKIHRESIHGISLEEGVSEAAQCWDCHGSHEIVKIENPESPIASANLPQTCGCCHDDPDFIKQFSMTIYKPGKMYSNSVHGRLVEQGVEGAPNCVDCHGVHDIKNRVQPGSQISSYYIPNTCGKCHSEIVEEYKKSIHWIRAKKGIKESPVCNDCHSEHSIHAINTVNKEAEVRKIQERTCFHCHSDPKMMERFNVQGGQAQNYRDSYHGLAVMRGDEDAAMCVDCHGVHEILPEAHPESKVNHANVRQTCQQCHEDAAPVFAKSYSHTMSDESQKILSVVQDFYIWFILIIIGGMVLHNLLIMGHEMMQRRKEEKGVIAFPRFTINEVIQHMILLIAFILLAITGFALKYPQQWWVKFLADMGMTESARQLIHRISAVVMLVLGLYHIAYLFVTGRGREVLRNLIPRKSDFKSVFDNLRYYLGLSSKMPEFDQYNYAEKAEYWALIWGTILMGITGLFLWFPTLVDDWAPVWLIKVSEIVHFYEAILASLAILVWHWFFVIFHPREYPMSFRWIDGKMSIDHFKHHHRLQFKRIIKEWFQYRNDDLSFRKLSHSTKLFLRTMKQNKLDPEIFIREQIREDPDLVDTEEGKDENNRTEES